MLVFVFLTASCYWCPFSTPDHSQCAGWICLCCGLQECHSQPSTFHPPRVSSMRNVDSFNSNKLPWCYCGLWMYWIMIWYDSLFLSSGVFELNFMSSQPASGYYQFTVAVTGDSRLVANHVEVGSHLVIKSFRIVCMCQIFITLDFIPADFGCNLNCNTWGKWRNMSCQQRTMGELHSLPKFLACPIPR